MPRLTEIEIRTVTPIFTGGIDGKADRVYLTGIIGSLRWWYEVITRGLGGKACDPSNSKCEYDKEKYEKAKKEGKDKCVCLRVAGVCDACQLFGSTGWSRRFRLDIRDTTKKSKVERVRKTTEQRFKKGTNREHPEWYFDKGGCSDNFQLEVIPLFAASSAEIIIPGLLKLIEKQASLAAKPQLGYGCIEIVSSPEFNPEAFVNHFDFIDQGNSASAEQYNNEKPALTEMFFAKIEPREKAGEIETMLNLKYDLRAAFRKGPDNLSPDECKILRHFICGTIKGKRVASKIAISRLVDGKLHLWAWIPKKTPLSNKVSHEEIMKIIYTTVGEFGEINSWREFSSDRDTEGRLTNPKEFLKSLLREVEE